MAESFQKDCRQPVREADAATRDDQKMKCTSNLFTAGRYAFLTGRRTYLMGILNTTPDSFSDGGLYFSRDQALRRAEEMIRQGVDIIDIGGESTRPGSQDVPAQLEIERTAPVISAIAGNFDIPVSIDSYKFEVAQAALKAGACIVNDIYGLLHDARLADLAAQYKAGLIVMHNARYYRSGHSSYAGSQISADASFKRELEDKNLIESVIICLDKSLKTAGEAGVDPACLLLDPGVGFGTDTRESIALIKHLPELKQLNRPILLGPSRKRFIGELTGMQADQRLLGTAAAVTAGIASGADFIRIHDVAAIKEVVQVADALLRHMEEA